MYLYSSRLSFGKLRKYENILSSFAPHDLSMILALMKTTPKIISCSGSKMLSKNIYDNSIINLRFNNKINSHIFVNWLNPFKEQKFVVIGTKNMLVFDDTQDWSKKIMCIKKPLINQNNSIVLNAKKYSYLKIKKNDALLDEIKYFLECTIKNKKPISNINESFKIYGLLDKAIQILNLKK
jgi:UDP-2-acetamido-3-amino-2,3-dideoxy-glucuronate N-acetyltransferase